MISLIIDLFLFFSLLPFWFLFSIAVRESSSAARCVVLCLIAEVLFGDDLLCIKRLQNNDQLLVPAYFCLQSVGFATHIPECLNNDGIQLLYDYFFIFLNIAGLAF